MRRDCDASLSRPVRALAVRAVAFACLLLAAGACGRAPGRAPELVTLLGGGGDERDQQAQACAVGPDGSLYLAGATESPAFPVTRGAFQVRHHSGPSELDGFVAKLTPDGRTLVWSTYLGGSDRDNVMSMTVDAAGDVWVTGITRSPDFPVTPGALHRPGGGPDRASDLFVAKLAADGSRLVWSAVVGDAGETDTRGPLVLDDAGRPWVVGSSGADDFPTTPDAVQPASGGGDGDALLFALEPDGSALHYSTYLGGSRRDRAFGLARYRDGTLTAAGWTRSPDFPVTEGAAQARYAGDDGKGRWGGDAWVARFSADGRRILWATFFGGPGDDSSAGNHPLALDADGRAVLVGVAGDAGVPTTAGAFRRQPVAGARNGFVLVLEPDGSKVAAATLTAGTERLEMSGVAVDAQGRVYHGGRASAGFPTTPDAFQPAFAGGPTDEVLSVFSPDLGALVSSTYLGGSGDAQESTRCLVLAPGGRPWVVGDTGSRDFPTTPDAPQRQLAGHTSAFGALWPALPERDGESVATVAR